MTPNHLAVYLTNRCNLGCKYCYVAVNQGETVALSFEHLKANIDWFLENVPAPDKKMTFLGGEPFLNFKLLQQAVEHVRARAGGSVVLQTFTNGTNLTQDKLSWLHARGVHVTVSLDGKKETNDAVRVFFKEPGRSVYDAVMARLEGLDKSMLGVSLVFDSRSVSDLLRNIEHFHAMGFARITFNPELYELWSEDRLAVLRTVMRGFRRYYAAVLRAPRPFTVPILFSVLETEREGPGWWHECHNVVLGADNRFYSCDKALTFPYEKVAHAGVGSNAQGMDWERRGGELADARATVERVVPGKRQYFCPMGVVFYSGFAGTSPDALLENFTRVSGIFGEELQGMVEELRGTPAWRALYEDVHAV